MPFLSNLYNFSYCYTSGNLENNTKNIRVSVIAFSPFLGMSTQYIHRWPLLNGLIFLFLVSWEFIIMTGLTQTSFCFY